MASYDALINLKLSSQGLKDLKRIEGAVDKINKPVRTANTRSRVEEKLAKSTEARRVAMIETRRVGDEIQRNVDRGLKLSKAQRAVDRSALANQKGEFKVSKAHLKVALDELKIQTKITEQLSKQNGLKTKSTAGGLSVSTGISSSRFGSVREPGSPRFIASRIGMVQGPQPASVNVKPSGPTSSLTRLTGNTPLGLSGVQAFPLTKELGMFGPKLPFLGKTTGFGSSPLLGSKDLVGSPKNILDVAKQNAMPVKGTPDLFGSPKYYEAVNKEAKKVAAMKGNVLPVSGMKHIVGSPEYLKEQARKAKLLKGASTGFTATEYGPQRPGIFDPAKGDFSRLKDRQSRNVQGKRTFMNNRFARMGLPMPTKGFDTQSALISGAFPLLFGQGPIGAAAGGLGGGIGGMFGQMGGFAGGIAATAIAQQIQSAITAIGELGKALGPFSQNTQAVTNALGLQGSAQEAQIQLIEQVKGKTAAFNAATALMAREIGQGGVKALEEFGNTSRLISLEFSRLILQVQQATSRLINFTNRVLGLSQALEKGEAQDLVAAAAESGNTKARALVNERKNEGFFVKLDNAINNSFFGKVGKLSTPGGLGLGFGNIVKNLSAIEKLSTGQDDLSKREKLFAVGEKIRIQAGAITNESNLTVKILQDELDLRKRIAENEKSMSTTLAEKVSKVEQEFDFREKTLKTTFNQLVKEKSRIDKGEQAEIDKANAKIEAQRGLIDKNNELKKESVRLVIDLHKETEKLKITREEIAGLLANETTNAIMGLIEGTKTLSESLAGVAKQLASMFLNKAFGSMFDRVFQAEGGYNRAGSFKAFQYGGVVSSPTLGMIGEGGEPEYVIPSSKMSGAMARYSAGARGGAVIPGGSGASGTVAGSSGNTIVEYTGPVLNFNGDEYVPKDSVPQIINAAAKQGATLGQSRTLNTLKNSRSSRAKIGI